MKKTFLILLTIILAFSITGCQSKETPKAQESETTTGATTSAEETEPEDEIDLTVNDEDMKDFEDVYQMTDVFPQLNPDKKGHPVAKIETTLGTIEIMLYPEYAPKTVENFIALSKSGYYDGVLFHRVMKDFMIQGGDPEGTGAGGVSSFGEPFEDEFSPYLYNIRGALSMANAGANTNGSQFFIVQNNLLDSGYEDTFQQLIDETLTGTEEVRYYKANFNKFLMPGTEDYLLHSNAGIPKVIIEKYIEVGGTPHLDYKHTVFGQVIEKSSFEVLDKIANKKVDANYKPETDVKIIKIEITEPES